MRKLRTLLLAAILSFSFCLNNFGQYADLIAKRAKIKGPWNWKYLGVAPDDKTCDFLILTANDNDQKSLKGLLESFSVLRVKNNTAAFVLETKIFEGKAKVLILEGLQEGRTGWVPLQWLKEKPVPLSAKKKKK